MNGLEAAHYPLNLTSLPRTWTQSSIGGIVSDIQPGFACGAHNRDGVGVPHLRPMNVDRNGRLELSVLKYVSSDYALRIHCGDVLFNNTNSPELVGKTTSIAVDLDLAFSNHMTRLRPSEGVDPKFLAHQLHFLWMSGYFRYLCVKHVNQASVSSEMLAEKVPTVLPPTREQIRIREEIEKQFTRLEAGVGALKRVQANLKRYRAAVLKAAVEGRLVPTEAELARREGRSYEPASELLVAQPLLAVPKKAQAGVPVPPKPKHKEPVAPDTTDLPKLPEGWAWTQLNELLIYIRNGISRKPDAEEGIPILRINAVRPRRVDMNEVRFLGGNLDDYADYVLQDGDLLFTRYNGNPALTGVCGMVRTVTRPTVHPDKLIRVRIVPETCLPAFAEVVLSAGASRDFIAGRVRTTAGQAGISGQDIRSTPVPLAPLKEQTRIVAEVERRLSVIDELEMQVETNLKRAERLRQAILKRAFEGKLVPQDPNDEPASMLLERIRNAGAAGGTATPGCAPTGSD